MKEEHYRILGWIILGCSVLLWLVWCTDQTGIAGWLMDMSERLIKVRLVQISWLITLLIIVLPGYIVKRYCDGVAWELHLESIPPPDPMDSSKRSKYVTVDQPATTAPKPVEMKDLPKGQTEFVATCAACEHLFSANRNLPDGLKCPNCGEALSVS